MAQYEACTKVLKYLHNRITRQSRQSQRPSPYNGRAFFNLVDNLRRKLNSHSNIMLVHICSLNLLTFSKMMDRILLSANVYIMKELYIFDIKTRTTFSSIIRHVFSIFINNYMHTYIIIYVQL